MKAIRALHLSEGYHAGKDDGSISQFGGEWNLELDCQKLGCQRKGHVLGTQERGHGDKASTAYEKADSNCSRPGCHPTGTLVSSRKQWTECMEQKPQGKTGTFNVEEDDVQSQGSSFQRNQEEAGTTVRCWGLGEETRRSEGAIGGVVT